MKITLIRRCNFYNTIKIVFFKVILRIFPITQKQGTADQNGFQIRIQHRKILYYAFHRPRNHAFR